jgi:hypothetical protein
MRLALLSAIAKLLRIQFKVAGVPYGATHQLRCESLSQSAQGML